MRFAVSFIQVTCNSYTKFESGLLGLLCHVDQVDIFKSLFSGMRIDHLRQWIVVNDNHDSSENFGGKIWRVSCGGGGLGGALFIL
jgi:hypothetical protein